MDDRLALEPIPHPYQKMSRDRSDHCSETAFTGHFGKPYLEFDLLNLTEDARRLRSCGPACLAFALALLAVLSVAITGACLSLTANLS